MHAVSVNGGELPGRAGKLRLVTGRTIPKVSGIDFAGEAAKVGSSGTGVSRETGCGGCWGESPAA
ncbi:hypothetical protein ACWGJX_45990 [Streptomyces sp. NPDC054775]